MKSTDLRACSICNAKPLAGRIVESRGWAVLGQLGWDSGSVELDALEAANEARRAVIREASQAAYEALQAVALCDMPPASQDQQWHLRAAARALARHWGSARPRPSAGSAR